MHPTDPATLARLLSDLAHASQVLDTPDDGPLGPAEACAGAAVALAYLTTQAERTREVGRLLEAEQLWARALTQANDWAEACGATDRAALPAGAWQDAETSAAMEAQSVLWVIRDRLMALASELDGRAAGDCWVRLHGRSCLVPTARDTVRVPAMDVVLEAAS